MSSTKTDSHWQKTLQDLRDGVKTYPQSGKRWLTYADFLHDECDDAKETVRAYEKASELLPSMDLRLRLGAACVDAGEVERGLSLIKSSLAETPRAHGYCILANAYLKCERDLEAEQACRQAIRLEEENEEAHFLYAEAVRKRSRSDAIRYYRIAVQLDPQYQVAWSALGREMIADATSRREGVRCLGRAIELNPNDGWSRVYMANALWRLGDSERAESEYKAAIKAFPAYADVYVWYAEFLESQERPEEAAAQRRLSKELTGGGAAPASAPVLGFGEDGGDAG
jgi:tetratricopeptide (TPR) repeat protein